MKSKNKKMVKKLNKKKRKESTTNLRKFKPQMRGRRLHLEKTIKSLWFKENLIKFKKRN